MSSVLSTVEGLGSGVMDWGKGIIDRIFPPEKREELMGKLKGFAAAHPKLAAFLLTNIAISGFPLFMFGVFTLTVFVFSLIVALLIALLVALAFTLVCVGVALFLVLPTTFLTTMAASFVFLWGLGGYYLLKWFNKGQSPAPEGTAIGDKLDQLTGGKLGWLMDSTRQAQQPNGDAESGEKKTPQKLESGGRRRPVNGTPKGGLPTDQVTKAADVNGVTSKATGVAGNAGGAAGKVQGTASGAKGAVGGATGLI